MRIGIDISQLAYPNTGVATYLSNLVHKMLEKDTHNEYVLFYSSMRAPLHDSFVGKHVILKKYKLPPTFLNLLWNNLHVFPVEWFIGPIDIFLSSDWTQPPSSAKKATIVYDMVVEKYPKETSKKILDVQKKRLKWVKKEVDQILCISKFSKEDIKELLKIPSEKITVIYPGI